VAALERLTGRDDEDFDARETVAMMIHTNALEKGITAGTSYLECFKGTDLRRTEIVCLTWAAQNLCGAGLMAYSTYFYVQAGLDTSNSFNMSLGQYALGFCGTILSWTLMSYFGRRTLYLGGLVVLDVLLFIIGFISLAGDKNPAASWATGSMLLVYTFFYDSTVGPVCYSLVSELSSTRLRTKTVVLSRNLYNMLSIVNGVIFPYMLNPQEWNWRGRAAFSVSSGRSSACRNQRDARTESWTYSLRKRFQPADSRRWWSTNPRLAMRPARRNSWTSNMLKSV
jgi:SP family general alpha glucoside:H+ symporter-like MFS transporter